MRRKELWLIVCLLLFGATFALWPVTAGEEAVRVAGDEPTIKAYFSPRGGAQQAIIRAIDGAQKSVHVLTYYFSSAPIAKSLLDAHKRGVTVEVILDSSQETAKYSSGTFFHNMGIPLLIDDRHAIMHNKVMIIDRNVLITGSFNFTKSAEERNAENVLILTGFGDLIEEYLDDYAQHRAHSRGYQRPEKNAENEAETTPTEPIIETDSKGPQSDTMPALGTVYVTKTGKKYHRGDCSSLRKSKIPVSKEDAIRQGFGACKRCKP